MTTSPHNTRTAHSGGITTTTVSDHEDPDVVITEVIAHPGSGFVRDSDGKVDATVVLDIAYTEGRLIDVVRDEPGDARAVVRNDVGRALAVVLTEHYARLDGKIDRQVQVLSHSPHGEPYVQTYDTDNWTMGGNGNLAVGQSGETVAVFASGHWSYVHHPDALAAPPAPADDSLPEWLHSRFAGHGHKSDASKAAWEALSEDDRSYWEHEAAAALRAVVRNGWAR